MSLQARRFWALRTRVESRTKIHPVAAFLHGELEAAGVDLVAELVHRRHVDGRAVARPWPVLGNADPGVDAAGSCPGGSLGERLDSRRIQSRCRLCFAASKARRMGLGLRAIGHLDAHLLGIARRDAEDGASPASGRARRR